MNSKAAYLCMTQTGYGTRLTARMKPLYRYLFAAMLPAAALSPMYASSPADTTAVTAKAPLPLPATGYEGRLLRSEFIDISILPFYIMYENIKKRIIIINYSVILPILNW